MQREENDMDANYTDMKPFERRETLMKTLKAGEKLTTRQIREMFGVSKATALRDVNNISRLLNITVEYGAKGGYRCTEKPTVELSTGAFEALSRFAESHDAAFPPDVEAELDRVKKLLDRGDGE